MRSSEPASKLQLINGEIDVAASPVLFDQPVTKENLASLFEIHNSEWWVEEDWLTGRNQEEAAGMAVFKQDYPGNILLEFECRTVLPSTHDINFMWNTEWSEPLNSCGNGYIGSICGWWIQRVGIERSPEFKLRATTAAFDFEPGKTYLVQAGSFDGQCFIFIDGKLFIELYDPEPLDNQKYKKVVLSSYNSIVQFKNIVIRQISWKPMERIYDQEF